MEIARDSETAAKLAADNPVVPRGLVIVEDDTGKAKLGDGATRWNSLGYWQPAGAGFEPTPQEVDPESETLADDLWTALSALGLVVEPEA